MYENMLSGAADFSRRRAPTQGHTYRRGWLARAARRPALHPAVCAGAGRLHSGPNTGRNSAQGACAQIHLENC